MAENEVVLKDEELEKVSGGTCMHFDQLGNVTVGQWYTDDYELGYIFKCVGIDVDVETSIGSYRFYKYAYNANNNTASMLFTITTTTKDRHSYVDASEPIILNQ